MPSLITTNTTASMNAVTFTPTTTATPVSVYFYFVYMQMHSPHELLTPTAEVLKLRLSEKTITS